MNATDFGFNKDNLLLVTINPTLGIRSGDASAQLIEDVRQKIRMVRGVASVSHIRFPIPYGGMRDSVVGNDPQKPAMAMSNYVGPDYFQVLGLRPISGREFSADDRTGSVNVAVINQNLAEELWPGQAAAERSMLIGSKRRPVEVIGVVPNASYSGFEKESHPNFMFLAEQQDRALHLPAVGFDCDGPSQGSPATVERIPLHAAWRGSHGQQSWHTQDCVPIRWHR
jgi:hypothetical protein